MKPRAVVILLGLAALVVASILLDGASLRYATEHPAGQLVAFGAYTGAFVLRTFSWRPFVPRWIPHHRLFSLLLAALFLNHVAPAKTGDLARMYGIAKHGVESGRAVAGVILARLADLGGLLAVLVCAWALAGDAEWGAIMAPAGVLLFAAEGVGLDLSVAGAVAATCFAVLATAVLLAPGGLGTYEAGMIFVLTSLGMPPGPAFAAAVLSHAIKYLYSLAAAPFAAHEGVISVRPGDETGKVEPDGTRLEV